MLQPATKALAHMLAGRAGASGQLSHARNLLAHAERLISDRVHNRLIPAEREEFFEQLARLRLTLADADAEAEVQAAEEQVEKRPPPPPVAHERLKEMALALSRPERDRLRPLRPTDEPEGGTEPALRSEATADAPAGDAAPTEQRERPALRPLDDLPGRLVLSKAGSESARRSIAKTVASRRARPPAPAREGRPGELAESAGNAESTSPDPGSGNGSPTTAVAQSGGRIARRTRKTKDGLPEGWVIDDEGYVVPRHG